MRSTIAALLVAACGGEATKQPPAATTEGGGADTAAPHPGPLDCSVATPPGAPRVDADGDGDLTPADCDDDDPRVGPGRPERCGDGLVSSCERRDACWTAELCAELVDPRKAITLGGNGGNELAALGDLRGDGGFSLGIGVPTATLCVEVGRDAEGAPITECSPIGGLYILELSALPSTQRLPDPAAPGVLGINGPSPGQRVGSSLEGLGDLDGDGYDDFIVGNDQRVEGEVDAVWLFWGPSPRAAFEEGVHLIQGEDGGRCLGYDMQRAGDLTGDAVDDLIVGDPCRDEVWVLSGADVQAATGPGIQPFARVIGSSAEAEELGMAVRGTADLTGDGLADLVVSAPDADFVYGAAERDYVAVYAGPLGGEVSPFAEAFRLTSGLHRDAGDAHTLGDTLDVGDLDGDGYADLIVGDPRRRVYGDPERNIGASLVFHGPLFGADLDTNADAQIQTYGGGDVQAHTDFDGDGRMDILVGSGVYGREGFAQTTTGAYREAYLFYSPVVGTVRATDDADVVFSCDTDRTRCEDFGMQVQAVPDQTGDGVPDVVVADWGNTYLMFPVPLPTR